MNPIEWSKAQDLLVKLVQALAPLAVKEVPATFFLNKRFFVPHPWAPEIPLSKHPIRLLTILQKEVNQLVGETPKKEEPVLKKEAPPVAKQAKQLIAEVQEAIGKLANSEFIQSPKEAPLKEAFKKLKPNLDQIIEAVAQEEETEEHSSFRHPLPRPQREEGMIKKPQLAPSEPPKRSPDVKQAVQEVKKVPVEPDKKEPEKPRGERRVLEKRDEAPALPPSKPLPPKQPAPPQEELFALPPQAKPPVEIHTPPPTAVTVPHPKNLEPVRKKKKKKGFWFREEREKEHES